MKSVIMKYVSVIVLVLNIILSVFAGDIYPKVDYNTFQTDFNTGLVIGLIVISVVFFCIMYSIATILEYLEKQSIVNNQTNKCNIDKVVKNSQPKEEKLNLSYKHEKLMEPSNNAKNKTWKCPKCGGSSDDTGTFCLECGLLETEVKRYRK